MAMYYALTTLSTVGFGDIYPVTDAERLICGFVMISGVSMFSYIANQLGLAKTTVPVANTRNISKADMVHNDYCPAIEVHPETYEVRADGELLTCEPSEELPMAQRYCMF